MGAISQERSRSARCLRPEEVKLLCEEAMKYISWAWNIYDMLRADAFGIRCLFSETGDDSDLLQDASDIFGIAWQLAGDDQVCRERLEEGEKSERNEP